MTRPSREQDWHVAARRMRAAGAAMSAIAKALGVSHSSVEWFLNEDNFRSRKNAQTRAQRSIGAAGREDPQCARTPRVPSRIIAGPEALLAAARAFARGEITRSELMARIEART